MDSNVRFAYMLKFVRTTWHSKLTIRDLSKFSGLSHPYISQLENNKRDSLPKPEILLKLSTGFGRANISLVNDIYNLFMATCDYISLNIDSALNVSKSLSISNATKGKFKVLFDIKEGTKLYEFRYILFLLGFESVNKPTDKELLDKEYQYKLLKEIEKTNIRNAKIDEYQFYENLATNIELSNLDNDKYFFYLDNELLSKNERTMILGTLETIRQLRK